MRFERKFVAILSEIMSTKAKKVFMKWLCLGDCQLCDGFSLLLNLFETSAYKDFIRRVIPRYFAEHFQIKSLWLRHIFIAQVFMEFDMLIFYPFYLSRTMIIVVQLIFFWGLSALFWSSISRRGSINNLDMSNIQKYQRIVNVSFHLFQTIETQVGTSWMKLMLCLIMRITLNFTEQSFNEFLCSIIASWAEVVIILLIELRNFLTAISSYKYFATPFAFGPLPGPWICAYPFSSFK